MRPEPIEPSNKIASEHDTGSPIGNSGTCITAEVRVPAGNRRRGSIRLWLASLVVACVLPVWIAAGFLVHYDYQSRRALTEQRMLESARALTMVVDRELSNMQASLSVLATSKTLASGDLPAFYRRARAVIEAYPGAYILLADATGQEFLNTIAPFGAPLPKYSVPDAVRQVYATGRPVTTNAFKGAFTGRLMISVHVPVLRDGRVVYDLAMNVPPDPFAAVLFQQHLPPEWIGRIFDGNQVVIARNRFGEQFVGYQAVTVLRQRMRDTAEGTAEAISLENVRMFNSFSRSATSGWTVVVGVSKALMMAEIWRRLWWTIAGTALLSLTGLTLAVLMARRISGSIQGLIAPVLALGRGEPVAIRHLELTEFDEAAESLAKASQLIQQNTEDRERAEAARRETEEIKRFNAELRQREARFSAFFETAAVGMTELDLSGRFVQVNQRFCQITGYSREELLGMEAVDLMHPEDLARERGALASYLRWEQPVFDVEKRYVRKNGDVIWVQVTAAMIRDAEGKPLRCAGIIQDITARRRAEEQLRATAERLKAILEHAPVGIVTNDRECYLIESNAAYHQICGYSAEELKGKKFTDHTHPDDMAKTLQSYEQLGSNKLQSYEMEKRYIRKDGKTIWVRVIASRINEETNIGIIEDITAQIQEAAELRAAKEAAESANRAKSDFLANMSHEIRTPMNGVMGMLELALDTDLKPEQSEYLKLANSSAEGLLKVIDDILDFSKIESGKLEFETIDFSLRDCLGDTLDALGVRAEQKGLELACRVDADLPELLAGDPGRLRQVITNLVGNAIKFTERGEIVVQAERQESSAEDMVIHFSIKDTGIGIPRERQEIIFAPFEQADGSITRRYGGTGLGLAISARLIAIMNGRIWVESEAGQGSTFHFTARFKVARSSATEVSENQLRILDGLRVLVVDDNSTNRLILEEMLTRWRMIPVCADGGVGALEAMRQALADQTPFKLVLLDSQMPDLDGFGVAQKIKQNPRLAGAPIMMLSSAGRHGDAARCRELGIAAYLTKPIRQSQLFDAMMAALGKVIQTENSSGLTTRRSPRESRQLNILLAEDNAVNQKIATRMLEKLGHRVAVAGNGQEALDAIARHGFDAILMDVQMPEMDGLKATEKIREGERQTQLHMPIIAMTAHAMKGDRERCIEAGMDGYISKPINGRELEEAIAGALHGWDDTRVGKSSETPKQDAVLDSAITWDIAQTLERLGGDEKLLHEVVEIFLEEGPKQMTTLRHAIEDGNAEGIEKTAHSLKGELGYLGISEVSRKACELEEMGREHDLQHTTKVFGTFEAGISGVLISMRRMNGRSLKIS
jgi:PAS domain S-box-containing protein